MKLSELRQSKGLTQRQLADRSGMSRPRLSEYERGVRPVSSMTLGQAARLADALKLKDLRKLLEP